MKRFAIFMSLIVLLGAVAPAQGNKEFETRRKQALTLFDLGRHTEALPLLRQLAKEQPDNAVILERYAMSLLIVSASEQNIDTRKQMRVEAKKMFSRSRELGNNSQIVQIGDSIPDDGSFPPLSERQDVDAAMQAGEAAFAKGDYDLAIEHYQKAAALDPQHYEAPLYVGDMYFRKGQSEDAGRWFAQAIAVDPNRETAYRYWGDALMHEKKYDEAKLKLFDAIIAEPYKRNSWFGLINWANANGKRMVRPNIQPPMKVEEKDDKNINITLNIDSKADKDDISGAAWLMYTMTHLVWKNEGEFLKKYPAEKAYRHSLAEQMAAFSGALEVIKTNQNEKKAKKVKIDAQLQSLMELDSRGLLEPYILLHQADEGIAQDYTAYRDAHRDKLREYLESLIVPK